MVMGRNRQLANGDPPGARRVIITFSTDDAGPSSSTNNVPVLQRHAATPVEVTTGKAPVYPRPIEALSACRVGVTLG